MPTGFRGNHAHSYLSIIDSALTTAREVHRRNPFENLNNRLVPPPSLPARTNHSLPHPLSTARSGGHTTGSRNSSNIVAAQSDYSALAQRVLAANDASCNRLQAVARELTSLCNSSYALPSTSPRCLSMLARVAGMRMASRSLTSRKAAEIRNFSRGISNIS